MIAISVGALDLMNIAISSAGAIETTAPGMPAPSDARVTRPASDAGCGGPLSRRCDAPPVVPFAVSPLVVLPLDDDDELTARLPRQDGRDDQEDANTDSDALAHGRILAARSVHHQMPVLEPRRGGPGHAHAGVSASGAAG